MAQPDMVGLDLPEAEPNKESTKTGKSTKKPQSKKSPAKSMGGTVIVEHTDDVAGLIQSGFAIVASRAGNVWNIEETEAQSIAAPLCRILAKYEQSKVVAENMDAIALIAALGTVVIPRMIIHADISRSVSTAQEQEEHERYISQVQGGLTGERTVDRKDERADSQVTDEPSVDTISPIKTLIPAVSS